MRLLHACLHSRKRALDLVDEMVAKEMRRGNALETIDLPKSTYYDWRGAFRRGGAEARIMKSTRPRSVRRRRWNDADDRAVLKLRAEYPFMGKAKLGRPDKPKFRNVPSRYK